MKELQKTTNKFKSQVLIFLANLLVNRGKEICSLNVKYLDLALLDRTVISPEALTNTFLPNYTSTKTSDLIEINAPQIELLELEEVIVSAGSSSFIKNNDLYIERYCNEENSNANYSSGCFISYNSRFALVLKTDLSYVDKGFFLGGNGSWNYYHWLIEILPKLQVYLELGLYKKGIKLLVPDSVKENVNLTFLLNSIIGDTKVDMIFVSQAYSLHVKYLYHLTPINNILFNERKVGLATKTLHLRYDSLNFITSKVERYLSLIDSNNKMYNAERIFLARKEGKARYYNQSEIIPLMNKHDFKIIYMEDFDIKQQIFLFKNAKYIVGPSGAAWSNLIFCDSTCKALSWLPETVSDFPVFSTLANFSNVELTFFNTRSDKYKTIHDNYIIDLNTFEGKINELLE